MKNNELKLKPKDKLNLKAILKQKHITTGSKKYNENRKYKNNS